MKKVFFVSMAAAFGGFAPAVTLGQIDNFEDGTTQGWVAALLGASHPSPPANIPSGGPAGVDDNYLQVTSIGGSGAGSKLVALNPAQWSGDYTSANVLAIEADVINLGSSDVMLRLMFEDPDGAPPANVAVSTNAISLAVGSGWQHVRFGITAADLTAVAGSVSTVLSHTTILRIFHSTTPTFPGESSVAQIGLDNIQAVPEPATLIALGLGGLAILRKRR